MKKLALKLEDLSVESFQADQGSDRRGTVVGHYGTGFSQMVCDTVNDYECSSHCIVPTYTWQPC